MHYPCGPLLLLLLLKLFYIDCPVFKLCVCFVTHFQLYINFPRDNLEQFCQILTCHLDLKIT